MLISSCFARPTELSSDKCAVPSWAVSSVNVTYSSDTYTPGTTSFKITNSLTHQAESLSCALEFNTLCQVAGTPLDDTLRIVFWINMDYAFVTFNKTWTCRDTIPFEPELTSFVIGNADLHLLCPEVVEDNMACTGPIEENVVANGEIVTPIPEPPVVDDEGSEDEV
ncbi:hypothetical protein B0T17DRAFT_611287 [Bombardia bombarda]|uniref:Uncharacterized protein n=1 Tax=Bombardia bombarda TaxID=252184 RepID=A0AA39XHS4_9PEZI|nr:hypothetical protein B0T17DRAFT_611287 [Bombardia bombarda]